MTTRRNKKDYEEIFLYINECLQARLSPFKHGLSIHIVACLVLSLCYSFRPRIGSTISFKYVLTSVSLSMFRVKNFCTTNLHLK